MNHVMKKRCLPYLMACLIIGQAMPLQAAQKKSSRCSASMLQKLTSLRQTLHQHPELSGQETVTAQRIVNFLQQHAPPDQIISPLGKTGLAAIYKRKKAEKGPVVLLRCELDALPIPETMKIGYQSAKAGVSHKCGHDGHMAILCGVALHLAQQQSRAAEVILLFQPAEETGQGAQWMLDDPAFAALKPDFVYALHNVPEHPLHQIIVKEGTFAPASSGLILQLTGKGAHASEPHKGVSPELVVAQLINDLPMLPSRLQRLKTEALVTTIFTRLGQPAFGSTPADAEVMFTLRAYSDADMQLLTKAVVKHAKAICKKQKIQLQVAWTDTFPATVNHPAEVNRITKAAQKQGFNVHQLTKPMPWSEDFGHFTQRYPGAMFGLGSGKKQSNLHNAAYDFPDALIPTGVDLFCQLIDSLN